MQQEDHHARSLGLSVALGAAIGAAIGHMGVWAAAGIAAFGRAQATIFGNGTSRSNFSFGGVTIVCSRLSASGGTEMIGCSACSGSPFFGN